MGKEIKIGEQGYVNKNCWLAKNLKYPPSKRCQYCESKFPNCLFFRYSIVSLILIILILIASFLIEGHVSRLVIISIFVLVIVYGYFFDKSTEDIIEANFAQRKAKEALEELSENLQEKVAEQTKELQESYQKVEAAYEIEKQAHKELKRIDEAKSQFIMATQHHLRTPLTALKGYLSMSLEGDFGKIGKVLKEKLASCFDST
ncbi:MAG: histidine kinase dimerization/phospho-acceptor domain-containing protein, partial [Patescibacteria group bacterium]